MLVSMKKLILLIVLLALMALVYVLTFVPIRDDITRPQKQANFEVQHAKWEAAKVSHYRMTVFISNAWLLCPPADLEILNGRVIQLASDDDPDFEGVDCERFSEFHDQYSHFTVEHAFEFVDQWLYNRLEWASPDSVYSVDVRYDEQYGFPVEMQVRTAIDHPPYMRITDFEVLSD
jgi:hypothetical protein